MCRISSNKFKRHYLKNKRLFPDFFLHFLNVHEIYKILKKNMSIVAFYISEMMDCERDGYLNV